MKHLLLMIFAVALTAPAMADIQDEARLELDQMNSRGWHHIGCVNQSNGARKCLQRARQQGYSHSRVQQDYLCNPRVFLTCYGWAGRGEDSLNEMESELSRSTCGGYVKPATCNSHPQCKWVGSCVPR